MAGRSPSIPVWPDRKVEGAVDLSEVGTTGAKPGEGSETQTPPPLTDQQLAEGSGTDIDGHPPVTEDQKNVHREIIVPKSVEGKWKAVKILVRDKSDEERNTMQTVELGSTFQLGDSGITVSAGDFFQISFWIRPVTRRWTIHWATRRFIWSSRKAVRRFTTAGRSPSIPVCTRLNTSGTVCN